MAKKLVGGLVATLLADSFGAGYGWTCRGSTECQPNSLLATDITLKTDVQLLQTVADKPPRIADQSDVNATKSTTFFVIGVNIAQAAGGSSDLATRKAEAESMIGAMQTAATTRLASTLAMALAYGGEAQLVSVDGSPVVYVFIQAMSFTTDPTSGSLKSGLESNLKIDFQSLPGWNEGLPYLVSLAATNAESISSQALEASSGDATASGDPHLMTMRGERFDIMRAGTHMLLQIPRGAVAETSLLAAEAHAERSSAACSDLYFKSLNLTGRWADELNSGGFRFLAGVPDAHVGTGWLHIKQVDVKVRWGRTGEGVEYLNVFFRHLGMVGFPVGGLLGEDDHSQAATPDPYCAQILSLSAEDDYETETASVASMA
jgi:hypothetical protein